MEYNLNNENLKYNVEMDKESYYYIKEYLIFQMDFLQCDIKHILNDNKGRRKSELKKEKEELEKVQKALQYFEDRIEIYE